MPYLTHQISPSGPVVEVVVGVSDACQEALTRENKTVPSQMRIRALVDTGASSTYIDPSVIAKLALTEQDSKDTVPVITASTGNATHTCSLYDISLYLPHTTFTYYFKSLPVMETPLVNAGYQALLGRDVLEVCLLVYDGATGIFTLGH